MARTIHKLRTGKLAPCGAEFFSKKYKFAGNNSHYECEVLPRSHYWSKVTCKACLEYKDLGDEKFCRTVPRG